MCAGFGSFPLHPKGERVRKRGYVRQHFQRFPRPSLLKQRQVEVFF